MFKIIRALKSALNWTAALNFASEREYSKALDKLKTNEKLSNKAVSQVTLLKAYLLLKLNKDEETVATLKFFLPLIEDDDRYNSPDRDYLIAYASWIIMSLPEPLSNQFSSFDIPKSIDDISEVPLKNVKDSLKRIFPLEVHKRWI